MVTRFTLWKLKDLLLLKLNPECRERCRSFFKEEYEDLADFELALPCMVPSTAKTYWVMPDTRRMTVAFFSDFNKLI
jgi:hypothetical protein